jgi:hypothetical protein
LLGFLDLSLQIRDATFCYVRNICGELFQLNVERATHTGHSSRFDVPIERTPHGFRCGSVVPSLVVRGLDRLHQSAEKALHVHYPMIGPMKP